jgi:diketogulonate reductase-like aldo/keto reductase
MQPTIQLASGHSIPTIGLGTWEIKDDEVLQKVIPKALEIGYRHIDTAIVYENEALIGKALQSVKTQHPRDSLFITSKVYPNFTSNVSPYDSILQSFQQSLKNLQTDYLDLYLIHWPGVTVDDADITDAEKAREYRQQAWAALEHVYKQKQCRSIGVSNFTVAHMESLLSKCSVVPHVNQIEYHPLMWSDNQEIIDLCQQKNIVVQAYSPLAHSMIFDMGLSLSSDKVLQWAAHAHGEKVILVKSVSEGRLKSNFGAVVHPSGKLTSEEIETLDQMYSGIRICDDPSTVA